MMFFIKHVWKYIRCEWLGVHLVWRCNGDLLKCRDCEKTMTWRRGGWVVTRQ
jgi:hypothetical protein